MIEHLVPDIIEVLTNFCARLYGRRGARNRALRGDLREEAARPRRPR